MITHIYGNCKMMETVCRRLTAGSISCLVPQFRLIHDRRCFTFAHSVMSSTHLKSNHFDCLYKCDLRSMAGHSKWQNIKNIKEEKDRLKSHVYNKYIRLIGFAVRENGSDPKINSKLASLLEQAKKSNVPFSTLESVLKKAKNKKTTFGTIQILGPGGCLLMLDYETDNISSTRHGIKALCKKFGANVLQGDGQWRAVYQQKGILKAVGQIGHQPLDAEKALDSAILAGAEEVQLKKDEEENSYLEFLCDPCDLLQVKSELEKLSYNLEETYIGYIPSRTVQLPKEAMNLTENLMMELGEMQEVVRIFENVQ